MTIQGSRVGIIGGSIAGCAAAIALQRAGCAVDVFERSSTALQDRGSGIAMPATLDQELKERGYLPADHPTLPMTHRAWMLADGTSQGRRLWLQQTGHGRANNWGVLWHALRQGVDDANYHGAMTMAECTADSDGVGVRFADGSERRFDVVIAADGYRSALRTALTDSVPTYAGYVLWRGNYPESRAAGLPALERANALGGWSTTCFKGGHGVYYPIPDSGGGRRINWAIYAPTPPNLSIVGTSSIPPGSVTPEVYAHLQRLVAENFPPDQRALVELSPRDEVSIQPIYDEQVDNYVYGRIALIGDAGSVSRPHTGSGATKAIEDALCLERLSAKHDDWDALLAAYGEERVARGRTLAEVGARIGKAQVKRTPEWGAMGPSEFEAWTQAILAGDSLYLYGDEPERSTA